MTMEVVQYATFEENFDETDTNFTTDTNLQFGCNFESNLISCIVAVSYKQKDKLILKIEANASFLLSGDTAERLTMENPSRMVLPQPLAVQFASLAYGTLRGIILAKTERSSMRNLLLPPCIMHNLIKEPIIFSK